MENIFFYPLETFLFIYIRDEKNTDNSNEGKFSVLNSFLLFEVKNKGSY